MSDQGSGYPGAPPGWYPDPAGGPGQRWWDGYAWTDTVFPPVAAPPPPPTPSPSGRSWTQGAPDASGLVHEELRISSLGRFAIAFPGVAALVNLAGWVADASQWRTFGHQFRESLQVASGSRAVPAVPNSLGAVSSLLVLFTIGAVVIECIWQFRAASAARALLLPAKRTPGWGVAFWFIPIVNFWMPYQAIRDCLDPADPNRAIVLRYWLFVVGLWIGDTLTVIGLMFSTPVGVGFALPAGICALGVLATAPRVVTAIAGAHRAAATP